MTSPEYRRCLCCGKYFEFDKKTGEEEADFCSKECSQHYVMCSVCGKYCEKIGNEDSSTFVCSEECAVQYDYNPKTHKLITH
ncbi:MAG: hypothetical protein MJB14_13055 [Spirochaetes bacterium]|nr:hypothetical protein [Spirochaetota bacterium]